MAVNKPPSMKSSPAGAQANPTLDKIEKNPQTDILGPFGKALQRQQKAGQNTTVDPDVLRARAASLRSKIPNYVV